MGAVPARRSLNSAHIRTRPSYTTTARYIKYLEEKNLRAYLVNTVEMRYDP